MQNCRSVMQYDGGTSSMLPAQVLGSVQLECSLLGIYRDSIRRVSVSGGLCRSAQFFPQSRDTAAGEGSSYCWSSASSASSPALDASARCSPVSLSFSSDGDLSFSSWGDAASDEVKELRAIALKMVHDGYMKSLIRAFDGGGSSSAHYGGPSPGPDELLLRSWFAELDAEWVLSNGVEGDVVQQQLELEDGCVSLQYLMERWIRALKTMVQVLCITQQLELRAKRPTVGGVKKAIQYILLVATGKMAEREQEVAQFARFAEASILRMLDFVDAVAAAALNYNQPPETLPGMLQVYACIVEDSPTVLALFKEASSTTSISMFDTMNAVFLRTRKRLSDAIWSMMEKVRASFLTGNCWQISPEIGGVHETTRLMMNYVRLLLRNEGALSFILQDEHRFRMFLSEPDYYPRSVSVLNLIEDMISCLEKQLDRTAHSIADPGLRYVFLMNNFSFISKKVSSLLLPSWTMNEDCKSQQGSRKLDSRERPPPMEDYLNQPHPNLTQEIERDSNLDGLGRIQRYIEAYLDASWEPVLSCLYHIPHCFQRDGGPLAKFESEFQRTYATQKLWKVPNPELRKRLRKAVIEKVISGYNEYLAERTARGKSNRAHARTPHELEELLEELFEG